jgi:hypothetical protein
MQRVLTREMIGVPTSVAVLRDGAQITLPITPIESAPSA